MDSENVRTIKELGFDAISPYGTQVGCYYEQDKMIFTQRQRLDGIIDFCPTFSSGLYGMSSGTSGYVPNDMIKTFLQRFKDEYVPTSSEDNILNGNIRYSEYVEGHTTLYAAARDLHCLILRMFLVTVNRTLISYLQ